MSTGKDLTAPTRFKYEEATQTDQLIVDTSIVMKAVFQERLRQLEKWGKQTHPDLNHDDKFYIEQSNYVKEWNEELVEKGRISWSSILLEEVTEVLEARDINDTYTELIQVMAVCQAWIEDIVSKANQEPTVV